MRNYKSVIRGLKAMTVWYMVFKNWHIDTSKHFRFWAHWWTPIWHDGRGPYFTFGIGYIKIGRGY
uniref:Uncharacterized protein n=1 Tax=viral metagenome TaxID=1070528 RepID=A0A6M3JKM8_9ZZZZ